MEAGEPAQVVLEAGEAPDPAPLVLEAGEPAQVVLEAGEPPDPAPLVLEAGEPAQVVLEAGEPPDPAPLVLEAGDPAQVVLEAGDPAQVVLEAGEAPDPAQVVLEAGDPAQVVLEAGDPAQVVLEAGDPAQVVLEAGEPPDPAPLVLEAGEPAQVVLEAGEPAQVVLEAGEPAQVVLEAGEPAQVVLEAGVSHLGEAAALLHQVGYLGPLTEGGALLRSCALGAACTDFTSLCVWLVSELKAVCSLVDDVCPTEGPQDAETFQLEMSGLLSELHCPYTSLTTGDVTSRLTNTHNCLLLLVFLSTELQTARILTRRSAATRDPGGSSKEALCELRLAGEALGLPEPSPEVPLAEFMRTLESKVGEALGAGPGTRWSPPLLKAPLLPAQWDKLAELHRSLLTEYERRMRMLTTRFDVTMQSFHWSERAKEKGSAMENVFWQLRRSLREESCVSLAHVLAAREEDSRVLQTCSATVCQKTNSAINKVLMLGHVPDRGGRPNEIEPPMPTWEKRREGGGRGQRHSGTRKKKRS